MLITRFTTYSSTCQNAVVKNCLKIAQDYAILKYDTMYDN
jgi:hypothetical protein